MTLRDSAKAAIQEDRLRGIRLDFFDALVERAEQMGKATRNIEILCFIAFVSGIGFVVDLIRGDWFGVALNGLVFTTSPYLAYRDRRKVERLNQRIQAARKVVEA